MRKDTMRKSLCIPGGIPGRADWWECCVDHEDDNNVPSVRLSYI